MNSQQNVSRRASGATGEKENVRDKHRNLMFCMRDNTAVYVVYVLGVLFSLILFFPGYLTNDSVVQLLEGRDEIYTDWHPPAMAILWHVLDRIIPGPFGMLLLNTILIWTGSLLISISFFKTKIALVFSLSIFALILYPPIYFILGAIWKDNLMIGLLIMAIGSIRMLELSGKSSSRFGWAAGALLCLCLSTLTRHNAIIAAMPLLFWMFVVLFNRSSKLIVSVITIVVTGAVAIGASVFGSVVATYHTNPPLAIVFFDIAGTIYYSDQADGQEIFDSIPKKFSVNATVDSIVENYDPSYYVKSFVHESNKPFERDDSAQGKLISSSPPVGNDTLWRLRYYFDVDKNEKSQVLAVWMNCLQNHTFAYLQHKLAVFSHVIGLEQQPPIQTALMRSHIDPRLEEYYTGEQYNSSIIKNWQKIQGGIGWRIEQWASHSLIYRPYIYFILSSIVLLILVINYERNRYIGAICVVVSGILSELALLLIAPSSDYRYSHYMIYAFLLSIVLALSARVSGGRRQSQQETIR